MGSRYSNSINDFDEYIDLINSANIVFTDSFYGNIFSSLMYTFFVTYKRKGESTFMISRIDTLLSKLKFKNRFEDNIKNNLFKIDFNHIKNISKKEGKKVYQYLKCFFKEV